MKRLIQIATILGLSTPLIHSQGPPPGGPPHGGPHGGGGPRPEQLGASPQEIGEPGIAWYTTWDTALEEAKRSNRPIFFMAAAATCNGISGVF